MARNSSDLEIFLIFGMDFEPVGCLGSRSVGDAMQLAGKRSMNQAVFLRRQRNINPRPNRAIRISHHLSVLFRAP
jgi:hypothetical protein